MKKAIILSVLLILSFGSFAQSTNQTFNITPVVIDKGDTAKQIRVTCNTNGFNKTTNITTQIIVKSAGNKTTNLPQQNFGYPKGSFNSDLPTLLEIINEVEDKTGVNIIQ